jgi:hypothetical protein
MRVQLKLLTIGSAAGPLYDGYYSTNGTTYTLASDGSNLSLPSTSSEVAITVPDNSTQIKLVSKAIGCNDFSFIVPVVTTTTTTTQFPLQFQVTLPCVTACTTNGTLTITSITGGSGPPYQTALIGFGRDTIIWNNYPQVNSYGNLQSSCNPAVTASGSLGVRSTNTGFTLWSFPTLCTTTTLQRVYVRIVTANGADTLSNNWTLYIDGVASDYKYSPDNLTSGVLVAPGTQIKVVYNSNVCFSTRTSLGPPPTYQNYPSDTLLVMGGQSYPLGVVFRVNNPSVYVVTRYDCIGSVQWETRLNACGQYDQVQVYPGSTCDCVCNPDCLDRYYLPPICGESVGLPTYLIQKQAYICNNNLTGEYQILETCGCTCNKPCVGEYSGDPYCGASNRNGKNPSSQYVDFFWACDNQYIRTETLDDCSCSCDQTCDGEYWGEPYCDGTGIQKRNKKYVCNNANTGEVQTLSTCSEACGAFVAPIWSPFTAPYCVGCNQFQDEVQTNSCCTDPPSGDERTVPLGASTDCGSWYWVYYCVNYGVAPYERRRYEQSTCTVATRNDELVAYDSPDCGYLPPPVCRTYEIIAYNENESVDGIYTNCAGFSDSFSFFGGPGAVGSVCAQPSSVYVTSGNGGATEIGVC